MSDAVLMALITGVGGLITGLVTGGWSALRWFLAREDRIRQESEETMQARDRELRDLRAEVRELERERWSRNRRSS